MSFDVFGLAVVVSQYQTGLLSDPRSYLSGQCHSLCMANANI